MQLSRPGPSPPLPSPPCSPPPGGPRSPSLGTEAPLPLAQWVPRGSPEHSLGTDPGGQPAAAAATIGEARGPSFPHSAGWGRPRGQLVPAPTRPSLSALGAHLPGSLQVGERQCQTWSWRGLAAKPQERGWSLGGDPLPSSESSPPQVRCLSCREEEMRVPPRPGKQCGPVGSDGAGQGPASTAASSDPVLLKPLPGGPLQDRTAPHSVPLNQTLCSSGQHQPCSNQAAGGGNSLPAALCPCSPVGCRTGCNLLSSCFLTRKLGRIVVPTSKILKKTHYLIFSE